jgi:flagellar basal-body rod protein FlgB
MAINLDRLAGFHHTALKVRADKMEVIAGNLANANTPGYKAKDIDFRTAMDNAMRTTSASQASPSSMVRTDDSHIAGSSRQRFDIQYRIPDQPDTGDANNVDVQVERNAFLENGMRYEASLMLLNGKFSGMKKALSSGGQ